MSIWELAILTDRSSQGSRANVARMEAKTSEHPYRNLEAGRLIQFYELKDDARRLKIVRRRGFGQCALSEFADQSIGIFVHRKDSPGDGGSIHPAKDQIR